jgi:release factor glutamine methyltransferase
MRAPTLCPRPETEELVDLILADTDAQAHTVPSTTADFDVDVDDVDDEDCLFIDVGCGSGALTLALLTARPRWRAVAIDVAATAVALTKENVQRCGADIASRVAVGRRCDFIYIYILLM